MVLGVSGGGTLSLLHARINTTKVWVLGPPPKVTCKNMFMVCLARVRISPGLLLHVLKNTIPSFSFCSPDLNFSAYEERDLNRPKNQRGI